MNNIEDNYLVSRDYDLLWKLVKRENKSLVVFIDWKYSAVTVYSRSTAIITKVKDSILIKAKDIEMTDWNTHSKVRIQEFKRFCASNNLSFIPPKTEYLVERCKALDELAESKMRYPEKYET